MRNKDADMELSFKAPKGDAKISMSSGTISVKDAPNSFYFAPKYTWYWKLHGDSNTQFSNTSAPCWFHRQMQRLILGIHWRKL